MSFFSTYQVEVGRVVLVTYGKDAGKLATIVEIVDHNRALISGPTTGVTRQVLNYKRLSLTPFVVAIPRGTSDKIVAKKFAAAGADKKFAESEQGKALAAKSRRAALNDFERFKVKQLLAKRDALLKA